MVLVVYWAAHASVARAVLQALQPNQQDAETWPAAAKARRIFQLLGGRNSKFHILDLFFKNDVVEVLSLQFKAGSDGTTWLPLSLDFGPSVTRHTGMFGIERLIPELGVRTRT